MRTQRSLVLACALTGVLVVGAPARADDITTSPGLPDLDVRSGTIAPTAAQRAGARALDAEVAWNQFGTPSTLVHPGGALGASVDGATARCSA